MERKTPVRVTPWATPPFVMDRQAGDDPQRGAHTVSPACAEQLWLGGHVGHLAGAGHGGQHVVTLAPAHVRCLLSFSRCQALPPRGSSLACLCP